jgi:hypothetical protein
MSTRVSPWALFRDRLARAPFRTLLRLLGGYGSFVVAICLVLGLFATRAPLRVLDRALGLRLRSRFIELLARISPG